MKSTLHLRTRTGMYRAAALVCVFLIALTGFIAAVHVHPGQSSASDHSCSVCALAHAGVLAAELGPQVPVLAPSVISVAAAPEPGVLLSTSAHFIRPPPAV